MKEGGELPTNRLVLQNFQKTLRISDVADNDAGRYRCIASNRLGTTHHIINVTVKGSLLLVWVKNILRFFVLRFINYHYSMAKWLIVEHLTFLQQTTAAPYWVSAPRNLILAPNETGILTCRVNGQPKPNIKWFVNGVPVESELLDLLLIIIILLWVDLFSGGHSKLFLYPDLLLFQLTSCPRHYIPKSRSYFTSFRFCLW